MRRFRALALFAAVMIVAAPAQSAAPMQADPQRTSFAPGVGMAWSARRVPAFQVVVQVSVQSSPGTSAATDPEPETESVNAAWLSRRTSHAESCMSDQAPPCP